MSLVYFDAAWSRAGAAAGSAASAPPRSAESDIRRRSRCLRHSRSSLLIATGIGLHNFAEGLAIGQSAAAGELSLALVCHRLWAAQRHGGLRHRRAVLGRRERPSWGFLGLLGLDRRRADVLRHVRRPGLGQRGRLDRLPGARRRLDPLRRDRAAERLPQLSAARRSSPGGCCSASCSASRQTSCSSPPAPDPEWRTASDYPGRVPLASVYPLVSSRSLRAAVHLRGAGRRREGRRRRRPPGPQRDARRRRGHRRRGARRDRAGAVGRSLDEIPPALVDLALWLADYYGSTRRARSSSSRPCAGRRGERPSPVGRESLAGEAEPEELTDEQVAAVARIVAALDEGRGEHFLLVGPTGSGKTEVYLQACAAALERGLGTIVLVPEIALAPQTVGRFRQRFGDTRRDPALGARRRRAAGRARADRARRGAHRRRRALGGVRADARPRARDRRRRGARRRRTSRRPIRATTHAPWPRSAPRSRAPSPSTGAPPRAPRAGHGSSGSPSRRGSARRCRASGSSIFAARPATRSRRRCSPSSARIAEHGGKAILLLNRRGVAPALHCRACGLSRRCALCDVALTLHARRRCTATTAGTRSGARGVPCVRVGELAQVGAGTQRLETELERSVPELERIRLDADTAARPGALRRRSSASRRRPCGADRHADGGQGPSLPGRRPRGGRRCRHRPRDARLPRRGADVPARHAARRAQRPRRARARARADLPARRDAARVRTAARRRWVPRRGARATARRSATRRCAISSRSSPRDPMHRRVAQRARGGPRGLERHRCDLLGPAPLLRLRGRHRAQLVAKTARAAPPRPEGCRRCSRPRPAMRRGGLTAVVDVDPQSL